MHELTEEQQAVYDRQLRVWGMEAQKRMNSYRLLIAGLGGLGAEVAKNLALAGVGHLTVMDERQFDGQNVFGNFLVPSSTQNGSSIAEATAASLQEMNPFIEVQGIQGRLGDKIHGAEFLKKLDMVIVIGYSLQEAAQIDSLCAAKNDRGNSVQFFYGRPRGAACFLFANMGESHKWHPMGKSDLENNAAPHDHCSKFCSLKDAFLNCSVEKTFERRTPEMAYCVFAAAQVELSSAPGVELGISQLGKIQAALSELQSKLKTKKEIPAAMLEAWVTQGEEFAPVAAICGGILGQEVVRAISAKGPVFRNSLYYHLADGHGKTVALGLEKEV